jgi:phytoene synthase
MPGEVRLQWWRDVLAGGGHGEVAANPVAAALRETVVRYRLPPAMLVDLIDARAFDLYDEPMATLAELEVYAVRTSSALIELAVRILSDGRDPGVGDLTGHAGIAYALAGLLRAFAVHAARGQLYLPADMLQRHGASREDILAGKDTTALRATLAELRLRARKHLAAAHDMLAQAPPVIAPALLPVALVRPVLDRMEWRRYRPFRAIDLPQWRRQWVLWRASRRDIRRLF